MCPIGTESLLTLADVQPRSMQQSYRLSCRLLQSDYYQHYLAVLRMNVAIKVHYWQVLKAVQLACISQRLHRMGYNISNLMVDN